MNTSHTERLKNSRSELKRVRADSLGRRLTQRILRTVLPQLATGLLAQPARRRRTAAEPLELSTVLDGSIVLLFRLLFLLHAEARGLRPHSEMPDGGASLAAIAAEIAGAAGNDRRQVSQRLATAYAAGSTVLYDRLEPRFQFIPAATDDRLQRIARFLTERKVPDRVLALAIDGLARDLDPAGALAAIDYRALDVRHLGSIYESLLEQQLVVSGRASVELSRDTTQRRATGSFYTPPAIVEHIIEQTVGAVLDEKLAALRPEFQAACEEGGLRAQELAERLFDIRVLDPAMGTGNFLLAAAECIFQRLASFLAEFPAGILQGSNPRILLKQQIHQRCLYGVDLDPLAVELAKFCLWLDNCEGDAPLPALEHHLRCGNALVG
ncbi:MAG TPA: DNA methyltransferase, partial [Pirellulales bacterium]|nr:DNA methyltransferase [Pirellulales bacterium]